MARPAGLEPATLGLEVTRSPRVDHRTALRSLQRDRPPSACLRWRRLTGDGRTAIIISMKVFISSLIGGFTAFRDSAATAVSTLKHTVTRAEEFGASPESPQRVCLAGVRECDTVILLLGERYGDVQLSGLSATHEEYREARDTGKPVLAFIQDSMTPEVRQAEFIKEVQQWAGGQFTSGFNDPADLFRATVAQLHDFELQQQRGTVDVVELINRAQALVPQTQHGSFGTASLCIVVTGGPQQQILRPAELESETLKTDLQKEALFGPYRILEPSGGTEVVVKDDQLRLLQSDRSLLVDQVGSVRIVVPAVSEREGRSFSLAALIEEDIQHRIHEALAFAGQLLDRIDGKGRLRQVAPVVAILNAGYAPWRTRAEQQRNPNSGTMGSHREKGVVVQLTPATRPRSALSAQPAELAEDFVVLLRRKTK